MLVTVSTPLDKSSWMRYASQVLPGPYAQPHYSFLYVPYRRRVHHLLRCDNAADLSKEARRISGIKPTKY